MDARGGPLRIVAILFMVMALCFPVFAGPTFIYGGDFNLQIPAGPDAGKGWMDDAIIEVSRHATISDIDVGITLMHSNAFDLQIFVQSPLGTRLCLNMYDFKDEFFKGEDYIQTIFDDEAEIPIELGTAPFTGRFRPKTGSLLEVFDGEDAYGLWRLQIYDMWYWDTGSLDRVELIITICEPTTVTLLAFGIGLTALFRPRRK
ncbi:MAG: proprotein convertase P-domain-containing protein [Planctomycetes bacterium]|nr:proprotein convertase P-domain-containing protein [Planctomycetota bacterium]